MSDLIPIRIRLETSTACQLRCPSCPTTAGLTARHLGTGMLRLEDFRRLLDENPDLREIELSNYGEAFLNPRLLEMLALAHERGVGLSLANGVNLNTVRDEVLEGLVRYQLRAMTVSIDGTTQESYERYRVRGELATVLANIVRINHYKRKYAARFPLMRWQFVVFGHNQHEMEAARKLAASLGMGIYFKMSWDDEVSPLQDAEAVKSVAKWPVATRKEFREDTGRDLMRGICRQLWNEPQINWDGRVLGCCRNFWGDFGSNVFEDGLEPALASEKMVYAKRMLQGQEPVRADIPCTDCELYQTMATHKDWLRPEELVQP